MFNKKGVQIFTPDGPTIIKSIPPEKVCKETKNFDGLTCAHCNFYNVISDGKARPLFFPSAHLLCVVSPFSPSCHILSDTMANHDPRRPHGGRLLH
jgi:hypothetical protein